MRQHIWVAAERIGGRKEAEAIVEMINDVFDIGAIERLEIIDVGYEDCNLAVWTASSKFVVKVFARYRRDDIPRRTVSIIEAIRRGGVRHPALLRDREGSVLCETPSGRLRFLVMCWVNGKNYYELGRPPTIGELDDIVEQAVRLHRVDHDPPHLVDPWSIPHLDELFGAVGHLLDPVDRRLVERVAESLRRTRATMLPHALIHGDLTKGNLLVTPDRGTYLIDLASANRWPRIQELAVMAANLMHGSELSLPERADLLASLYTGHQALTDAEQRAMQPYAFAAAAMEFLGAVREKMIGGDTSDETNYILELGRSQLHADATALR